MLFLLSAGLFNPAPPSNLYGLFNEVPVGFVTVQLSFVLDTVSEKESGSYLYVIV